jgi:spermidine/putrescine transport system permease protein
MSDDTMVSRGARRSLKVYFALFLVYLYLPTALLLIFAFNDSPLPQFPITGLTLHWFSDAWNNGSLRTAMLNSLMVAGGTSIVATTLALLAAYPISRGRFRGRALVSAFTLVPLVVPPVVLGGGLLIFLTRGPLHMEPSLFAVLLGHVVITFPYAILLLVPRLAAIDSRLEEAARDLGASPLYTMRRVILPLLGPSIMAAVLTSFVLSLDEYAVSSFVVGGSPTYPVYLYSQLRFAERLPLVIAVAAVLVVITTAVIVLAEVIRRRGDRRLSAS